MQLSESTEDRLPETPKTLGVSYRQISGFVGYIVGSDGSVWSCRLPIKGGRIGLEWRKLKPLTRRGYLRVSLKRDGVSFWRSVHHLVLDAFIGERPDGTECCHYPDPDKTNNSIDNIRWGTPRDNASDSIKLGKIVRGTNHKSAKLTDDDIPLIKNMVLSGKSRRAVAREYGVSHSRICEIVNCVTWKHVT